MIKKWRKINNAVEIKKLAKKNVRSSVIKVFPLKHKVDTFVSIIVIVAQIVEGSAH